MNILKLPMQHQGSEMGTAGECWNYSNLSSKAVYDTVIPLVLSVTKEKT